MSAAWTIERDADATLVVALRGPFLLEEGLASVAPLERALDETPAGVARFDTSRLERWDTSLVSFVAEVAAACRRRTVRLDTGALPSGARRILALVESAPPGLEEMAGGRASWVQRVGCVALAGVHRRDQLLELVGRITVAIGRLLLGRARVRGQDVLTQLAAAGAEALPIVGVVSVLVGMILAFVAAVTLRPFGASLYVANVVTVGMVRELAAVMTAIVMAGRTGSAYAAELGTMNVTEETHALITMGIDPIEFLVLPRLLALSLMAPLLFFYANLAALVGAGLVAVTLLDFPPALFVNQSQAAVPLHTLFVGLGKSAVFGALVALAGCAEGIRSGESAADVGRAATGAVVRAIVWVIIADGVFAVFLFAVGL